MNGFEKDDQSVVRFRKVLVYFQIFTLDSESGPYFHDNDRKEIRMIYENLVLDEERALYGIRDCEVRDCVFAGKADGESALKECRDIKVMNCKFELRYPLWHVHHASISGSTLTETCRAALWYDKEVSISHSQLGGIKALRECDQTELVECEINSTEFGWFCRGLTMQHCKLQGEYPFLKSRDMQIENLDMKGKYSFQYVENVTIKHSNLDTKDAFWHSKNVTVYDSVIKGEYLGWYSENLKLVRCKIIGTQPLCYAKGLVLEDCEMEQTDLSFENSDVKATVRGEILSVKNPISGKITADHIGQIIFDEHYPKDAFCEITCKN